jgi:hypothetical protein
VCDVKKVAEVYFSLYIGSGKIGSNKGSNTFLSGTGTGTGTCRRGGGNHVLNLHVCEWKCSRFASYHSLQVGTMGSLGSIPTVGTPNKLSKVGGNLDIREFESLVKYEN